MTDSEVTYLSMPDPCPHLTRMEVIAAKIEGGEALDQVWDHLDNCAEAR